MALLSDKLKTPTKHKKNVRVAMKRNPLGNKPSIGGLEGARGSLQGGGGRVITMQPFGHAGRKLSPGAAKKLRTLQRKHGISTNSMKGMIEGVNQSLKK